MSLEAGGKAPYTTVTAMITVMDWFRDRYSSGAIDEDTVTRAGVPASLAARTIRSLVTLDLISKDGQPSKQFLDLREIKGSEEYKSRLQEWIRATYAEVLTYCDPSQDSYERIIEAFRGYEPQGQRAAMASLFIGLWKYAGLEAPSANASGSAKPPSARKKRQVQATARENVANRIVRSLEPSPDDLPPGLVGLLHQIPRGGAPWTETTRKSFLEAFTAVLNFTVPIGDPSQVGETVASGEEDE